MHIFAYMLHKCGWIGSEAEWTATARRCCGGRRLEVGVVQVEGKGVWYRLPRMQCQVGKDGRKDGCSEDEDEARYPTQLRPALPFDQSVLARHTALSPSLPPPQSACLHTSRCHCHCHCHQSGAWLWWLSRRRSRWRLASAPARPTATDQRPLRQRSSVRPVPVSRPSVSFRPAVARLTAQSDTCSTGYTGSSSRPR